MELIGFAIVLLVCLGIGKIINTIARRLLLVIPLTSGPKVGRVL